MPKPSTGRTRVCQARSANAGKNLDWNPKARRVQRNAVDPGCAAGAGWGKADRVDGVWLANRQASLTVSRVRRNLPSEKPNHRPENDFGAGRLSGDHRRGRPRLVLSSASLFLIVARSGGDLAHPKPGFIPTDGPGR